METKNNLQEKKDLSNNNGGASSIEKTNKVNLFSLSVVRRDGSITPFKSPKITSAIRKAFLAQTDIRNNEEIDKTVNKLTETVTSALTRRIADGDMVHIEDIQDQVELALMREEHHKVARAYVLYREQRASQRYQTDQLKEQAGGRVSSMMVLKRDGDKEPVSLDKITNRIAVLSNGLEIDPIIIAQKAIQGLYNDITTTEIDNYLSETAAALTVEHPDYSYLAGRIKANALHKETPGFVIASKNLFQDGLLNEEYYKKVQQNAQSIETIID
jgi:transcriptional regulator NrdR family protein